MKFTRIVSVIVAAASLGLSGFTALQAQSLRGNETPAEFPPASYKGKQYVDSRGCIFIRAGIDGNTTWIPRVTRDRRLVCGYKPSLEPGAATTVTAAPRKGPPPEQITLPPSAASPTTTASASAPRPDPLTELLGLGGLVAGSGSTSTPSPAPEPTVFENPAPSAPAEPRPMAAPPVKTTSAAPTPRKPSPAPEPTIFENPAPSEPATPAAPQQTAATPVRTTSAAAAPRKPSPAPAPTVFSNPEPKPAASTSAAPADSGGTVCPGASALSQKYINSGKRYPVRCGPQAESPVTVKGQRGSSLGIAPHGSVAIAAAGYPTGTRVVPRHVYDNRQNTQNVSVPKGYRTVWDDDRLNPRRAERTTAPYEPAERVTVPNGYRVAWDDGRLNRNRGGNAQGDAQTKLVWTDTVPRKLVRVPTDRQVLVVQQTQQVGLPRARTPVRTSAQSSARATREATAARSASPSPAAKPRYIRVATFASDAEARAAGKTLARRTGLSVRLGTLTRKGKAYRVVMAGPYTSKSSADTAMAKVRGAGYPRARLSK